MGCRQTVGQAELERFIYHESVGLVFDMRKKAPGRGAYTHPDVACLTQAATRGGFSRAFKRKVVVDAEGLVGEVIRGIYRRLIEGLRVAMTSQNLYIGATAVVEALKNKPVGLILLAEDASPGTEQRFAALAERDGILLTRVASAGKRLPEGQSSLGGDSSSAGDSSSESDSSSEAIALSTRVLGELCGRDLVAVVAVAEAPCLAFIRRDLQRLARLSAS